MDIEDVIIKIISDSPQPDFYLEVQDAVAGCSTRGHAETAVREVVLSLMEVCSDVGEAVPCGSHFLCMVMHELWQDDEWDWRRILHGVVPKEDRGWVND